jgi:hypothetical protein
VEASIEALEDGRDDLKIRPIHVHLHVAQALAEVHLLLLDELLLPLTKNLVVLHGEDTRQRHDTTRKIGRLEVDKEGARCK